MEAAPPSTRTANGPTESCLLTYSSSKFSRTWKMRGMSSPVQTRWSAGSSRTRAQRKTTPTCSRSGRSRLRRGGTSRCSSRHYQSCCTSSVCSELPFSLCEQRVANADAARVLSADPAATTAQRSPRSSFAAGEDSGSISDASFAAAAKRERGGMEPQASPGRRDRDPLNQGAFPECLDNSFGATQLMNSLCVQNATRSIRRHFSSSPPNWTASGQPRTPVPRSVRWIRSSNGSRTTTPSVSSSRLNTTWRGRPVHVLR